MKRPQITKEKADEILVRYKVRQNVALVGLRGYFRDSIGKPGQNDRNVYDDAIAFISPTAFMAFNANTDPSRYRKGIATLQTGVWQYRIGKHKILSPLGYKALVQAGPVMVARDGQGIDSGYFGINIHKGGVNSTSSLGCQTIPPDQWQQFINLVEGEMKKYGWKTIPYVLVEQQG